MPALRYQRYHEEKAKGGLALTMFGGSSNIAPDSPSVFNQLNVGTDEIIPYFQEFSKRIHQHNTALMCQITHMGGVAMRRRQRGYRPLRPRPCARIYTETSRARWTKAILTGLSKPLDKRRCAAKREGWTGWKRWLVVI